MKRKALMNSEKLNVFLDNNLGKHRKIVSLTGDASSRSYYRVITDSESFILCIDPGLKNNRIADYPFFRIHELFLRNSVPVPGIIAFDEYNGFILEDDLGDISLQKYVENITSNKLISLYKSIINCLVKIQSVHSGEIDSPEFFDTDRLMYEFDFFIEHTLKGFFNAKFSSIEARTLRNEFKNISHELYRLDLFVINHRDFHSRNIMIHDNDFYIIDFQDARMGLPQYDAVSLLRDAYLFFSEDVFAALKDYYYIESLKNGIHDMSRPEFDYLFDLSAYQRNIKAAGSYGFLINQNKPWFRESMKVLDYLPGYVSRNSILKKSYEIISDYITE